jgi:hypothetical protein
MQSPKERFIARLIASQQKGCPGATEYLQSFGVEIPPKEEKPITKEVPITEEKVRVVQADNPVQITTRAAIRELMRAGKISPG